MKCKFEWKLPENLECELCRAIGKCTAMRIHYQKRTVYVCNICVSDINRLNNYRMTKNKYHQLLKRQGYVCDICKHPADDCNRPGPGKHKGLCVDHSHVTGKTRGLLCNRCNSLLAFACEDILTLKHAIKYLKRHSSRSTSNG